MKEKDKFGKNVLIVTAFSLLGKLLALLRESGIAARYGANGISDAYFISQLLPLVVFEVFARAINKCFMPVSAKLYKKDQQHFNKIASMVMCGLTFLMIAGMILLYILMPYVIKVLVPGFEKETFELAVIFSRISMVGLIVMPIKACLETILQISGRFTEVSLLLVFLNLPAMCCIFLTDNIYVLLWVIVGATIGQIIILLPGIKKTEFKFDWYFNLEDQYIKQMLSMIFPILLGVAVKEINIIVDKTLASGLKEGSISVYNYASKAENAIYAVLVLSFINVIYPRIAQITAKDKFVAEVKIRLKQLITLILPLMAFLLISSELVIVVLFKRGTFTQLHVVETSAVFSVFVLGIMGYAFTEFFNCIFYSIRDVKTPVAISLVAMLVNVGCNLLLVQRWEVKGLATAYAFSAYVSSGCLGTILVKRYHMRLGFNNVKGYIKNMIAVLLAGGALDYFYNITVFRDGTLEVLIRLIFGFLIFVTIYLLVLMVFKDETVLNIYKLKGNRKG